MIGQLWEDIFLLSLQLPVYLLYKLNNNLMLVKLRYLITVFIVVELKFINAKYNYLQKLISKVLLKSQYPYYFKFPIKRKSLA